jgi:hypothetical protein
MNNIYSNETLKQIRKIIKAKCPTLKVKKGRATGGVWIDVEGSLDFGYFTVAERNALIELGFSNPGANLYGISPEERKYLVEKWGIA